MTKVKKNEGYDIYEHVHRFAAWAAARAASTKGQRFKVKKGKELIEAARLKDYLNGKKSLPDNPKGMDKIHRMWRKSVRSAADERGFVISHPTGNFPHALRLRRLVPAGRKSPLARHGADFDPGLVGPRGGFGVLRRV